MKISLPQILKFCLFLGIGLLLVWWSVKDLTPDQRQSVIDSIKAANYGWIFLSLSFALMSHFSRAMRWRMMLGAVGKKPGIINTFLAILVNYIANLAFPRMGEVARCGIINRYEGVAVDKALGTMVTERVIDLVILVSLVGLLLLLEFQTIWGLFYDRILADRIDSASSAQEKLPMMVLFGILGIVVLAIAWRLLRRSALWGKIMKFGQGILEGMLSVAKLERLPLFLAHTVFIWAMYYAMIYVCFFSMPETYNLGPSVGLAVLVFGSFGMVATQGGLGAYQVFVTSVLVVYGLTETEGTAFSWMVWSAQNLLIITAGVISLILLPILNGRKDQTV